MFDIDELPAERQIDAMQSVFDVRGRVIVLTGGAGLLGAAYSHALSLAGAHVVVVDVDLSLIHI